ncbi:hypothetical protein M885DRAFT_613006 [Pelagophyceae sp. CCMP2097]|nr:hypothetical protein M885DRAFT_613006 [Pelagophyceae sp. CCMP2097]
MALSGALLLALLRLAAGFETEEAGNDLSAVPNDLAPVRPHLRAYDIGEGFEGSASDWAEYVVWTLGLVALVVHFSTTVKVQAHAPLPEDATIAEDDEDEDADAKKDD